MSLTLPDRGASFRTETKAHMAQARVQKSRLERAAEAEAKGQALKRAHFISNTPGLKRMRAAAASLRTAADELEVEYPHEAEAAVTCAGLLEAALKSLKVERAP